jgi:hypothetical protein
VRKLRDVLIVVSEWTFSGVQYCGRASRYSSYVDRSRHRQRENLTGTVGTDERARLDRRREYLAYGVSHDSWAVGTSIIGEIEPHLILFEVDVA